MDFFYLFGLHIESISLSSQEVELWGSKNLPFLKYYNALKWESSLYG